MRGLAKGQSGLMVAVIALILAIPFSQIPDFTVKYVTSQSLESMEKNSMRYQSAVHSYKFTSKGENGDVNYTNEKSDIVAAPSGSDECTLDPGEYSPQEYNVSFNSVRSGTTFSSKDCLQRNLYVLNDNNLVYPAIPFREKTQEDRVNIVTRVVP